MALWRPLALASAVPWLLLLLPLALLGPRASAAEETRGDPRFSANNSYVGREVPCTHDEKVCFKINQLYHPEKDRCNPLGEGGHSCFLAADRHEFEHGSGHVVGVCRSYDDITCRYWMGTRMARDQRCYAKELERAMCGCEGAITQHVFGGGECRCAPQPPQQVEQPEEEGRCRMPDFRAPHPNPPPYGDHPLTTMHFNYKKLSCGERQRECFAQGKVLVEGATGCHELLQQGPCPEEHVVVLDGRAAEQRREAAATCAHVRGGCPRGQRRMGYDAECHPTRDTDLTAPDVVQMNVYGVHEVLSYAVGIWYVPTTEGALCKVQFVKTWPRLNRVDLPELPCSPENTTFCEFKQIISTLPSL